MRKDASGEAILERSAQVSGSRPMAWDPIWERIFRERSQWGRYPPEELVRFVARYYYGSNDRGSVRFLEVGCGPGAGPSWYLAREGYAFCGIDGSGTAVEMARRRFRDEGLQGEFNAIVHPFGAMAAILFDNSQARR